MELYKLENMLKEVLGVLRTVNLNQDGIDHNFIKNNKTISDSPI
jgi:hypothetical protein